MIVSAIWWLFSVRSESKKKEGIMFVKRPDTQPPILQMGTNTSI